MLGVSTLVAHVGAALDAGHDLGVVAHLAHPLGETKLVTSISFRPAACRRCNTAQILTAAGTGCFSFCRPSRGPDIDQFDAGGVAHGVVLVGL